MRPRFFSRLLFIFGACTLLLLVALTGTGLTQTDVPSGPLGFVKMSPVALGDSAHALDPESLLVFPAGATTSKGTLPADLTSAGKGPGTATQTMSVGAASSPIGGVIPGLDRGVDMIRAQLCAPAAFTEYDRARSILHRYRRDPATGIRDHTTRYPAFRRGAP